MGQFSNCTGGVSRYIDELLVGESHMYQLPAVSTVYHTVPFDPEGLLGELLYYHLCLGSFACT